MKRFLKQKDRNILESDSESETESTRSKSTMGSIATKTGEVITLGAVSSDSEKSQTKSPSIKRSRKG